MKQCVYGQAFLRDRQARKFRGFLGGFFEPYSLLVTVHNVLKHEKFSLQLLNWPRYSCFCIFRVCSAYDKCHSAYAQHTISFHPRMLSLRCISFRVCSAQIREFWNFEAKFRVCSANYKSHSAYAQHTISLTSRMLSNK